MFSFGITLQDQVEKVSSTFKDFWLHDCVIHRSRNTNRVNSALLKIVNVPQKRPACHIKILDITVPRRSGAGLKFPAQGRRDYQTASYWVHSVPALLYRKSGPPAALSGLENQNREKCSVGFYKHFYNFMMGKVWGLGKGDAKMAEHCHCPPESSHRWREPGGKMTAKHSKNL